jgi:hypothetical protein
MWGKGRKERKWRAQFEHLGRERVSELVEIGAIPRARKRDAAQDQDQNKHSWERWRTAFLIFGAIAIALCGVIATMN